MLKITQQTTSKSVRMTLEGRLAGPWVEELERSWRRIHGSVPIPLVVDLTGVTFIGQSGKALLTEMLREGAEFVAAGCCTKSIVEELKQSAGIPLEKRPGKGCK